MSSEPKLGNLGQAARGNQLRLARGIMLFVGILSMLVNGFQFVTLQQQIDKEVMEVRQQGLEIDQNALAGVKSRAQLVFGVAFAIGLLFVLLAIMVYQFPVPCTLSATIVYIVAIIGFGILDPMTLMQGVVVKVLIIAGLIKSVKSAYAYEAEKKAATFFN